MQLTMLAVTTLAGLFKFRVKFLHRVRLGADAGEIFNWPTRDDVADVHVSCVFYGPVHLIGNSPFKIMEHEQVKEVFRYIQRR